MSSLTVIVGGPVTAMSGLVLGLFGTRATAFLDIVLVATILAPLGALVAANLARRKRYGWHMRAQLAVFSVLVTCLLCFEGYLRYLGGSGSLTAGSRYAESWLGRALFPAHIIPAGVTYVVWTWLVIKSLRRRSESLPGAFSRRHRMLGRLVMIGLSYTAVSATAVYVVVFGG